MKASIILFPLAAIFISILAVFFPEFLAPHKTKIIPLLGIVMFGMGMSLRPKDFTRVCLQPKTIGLGLLLQFSLMPLIAFLLSKGLGLSIELMAGLVLVGACPGGTASNVICYLAKGDVALSISITAVSTLLAVFLTPALTWLYVGQMIDVPVVNMLLNIVKIILVPVSLGLLVNVYLGKRLVWLKQSFPYISMLAIIIIIGIIVALNEGQLKQLAIPVLIAVCLHNLLGLSGGYFIGRALGYPNKICKTLAIEVGMQNSGLGVALALKYFPASAALPGALFSIWHNISGAILASYCSRKENE